MADNEQHDLSLGGEDLFVDVWQSKPCLWDPGHADYKNCGARNAALRAISDTICIPIESAIRHSSHFDTRDIHHFRKFVVKSSPN